ncbi:MAG: triose-phosphate transporter family protein [Opitutaceae bacterium]|jgi:drug/metabolite transporter (DMT)-like permease|nr:triose-phosphate transporter family protein [Opitutaceae bacterium]
MHWLAASLLSAFFLGLYDLSKKHAVRGNAVVPVLFLSTLCGAALWGALLAAEHLSPGLLPRQLVVRPLALREHALIALKSAIVGSSWMFSYFALKRLPVSLASPIAATGPLWTLLGALLILGERPNALESAGIATTLLSFAGLSLAGRAEGVRFHRDRGVLLALAGTLLNAVSSLYDKHLMGAAGFSAAELQSWFSIWLAVFFLPFAIGWKLRLWPRNTFRWRWSIPLITAFLLVADFVYFGALREPDALVSVVASLRRGSTLVAFAGGLWLFRESNGLRKLPAVLGILLGITLTLLG